MLESVRSTPSTGIDAGACALLHWYLRGGLVHHKRHQKQSISAVENSDGLIQIAFDDHQVARLVLL